MECDCNNNNKRFHTVGTTILAIRKNKLGFIAGDGQVTLGTAVMKSKATKVRRLANNIICGFAGSTADAATLMERLVDKLSASSNQLKRACLELAKAWRTDKYLRNLEAMLVVMDPESMFIISGNGDVVEPTDGVAAIGSGGNFALSAARALMETDKGPEEIVKTSMRIASELCIYTNDETIIEQIDII